MASNIILFIILGFMGAAGVIVFLILFYKKDNFYQSIETLLKNCAYQKVLKICEKMIDSQPHDFAIKYYMAEAYNGLKNYQQSILYYEKACIGASASDQEAVKFQLFMKTAELYRKMKKNTSALGYYSMVLDRDPQNTKALFASGEILYEEKSYIKAKGNLETLIKLQPSNLRARFILAKIYTQVKNLHDAAGQLETIYESEKLGNDVFRDNVTLLLSEVYIGMKNYQKAIEILRPMLDNKTRFEEILTKIIEIMLLANQTNEAADLINQYFDQVSKNKKCELLYYLGTVNYKKESYYQAIKVWNEAFKINPKFKDLSTIYSNYSQIINNPNMESVFGGNSTKIEILIHKLSHPEEVKRIIRKKNYWSFKTGDFVYFLYLLPSAVSAVDLSDMAEISIKEYRTSAAFTIYSLFGAVKNVEGVDYRAITITSDSAFIKLLNEKLG